MNVQNQILFHAISNSHNFSTIGHLQKTHFALGKGTYLNLNLLEHKSSYSFTVAKGPGLTPVIPCHRDAPSVVGGKISLTLW